MKRSWIRLYTEVIHDPKIARLSDRLHRFWIGCLCIAAENEGALPAADDIAFVLRIAPKASANNLKELELCGLLDRNGDTLTVHGWQDRQYESDSAAERMRRHRQRTKKHTVTSPLRHEERNCYVPEQNRTEQNRTEQNRTDTEQTGFDGHELFARIYSQHPNRGGGDRGIAENYLAQSVAAGADPALIESRHAEYCQSGKWASGYAPKLSAWLLDRGWELPPPPEPIGKTVDVYELIGKGKL